MFVAKKQDATSEAQSGAFYAPQTPISQIVPPGNGIARNHPETLFCAQRSGLGMFVAKKQDATSEVESGAFYAPQNPISQLVPPATESRETNQKLSFGPKQVDWACSL